VGCSLSATEGLLIGSNELSLVLAEDELAGWGKLTGETDPTETEAIDEELNEDGKLLLLVKLSPD
jgi:hypothetical protein